jgi:hypothetical protein
MKEDILQSALKDVQLFGTFESHKAEIDAEDLSWILQILSTNLYSDPIGSLIREYSSNAWDANVEAGNKSKPIEVGVITTQDSGSYWYVTDLGPGLSPHRINTVYRKFGKSTKRQNNEAIGMMGLGKFSGLSYTNEIFITTRVDGMQYEYLMHKSDGIPQIDLLITKLTDLPNGTTIKVNIKNWSDKKEFMRKTQEQLAYFENVYFNIDEVSDLNSKFKLIKGKTFTYSSLDSRELRLKIGPVSYPIDFSVIEYKSIDQVSHHMAGMAINFTIGELAITPNRESILYNKATIDNIKARLKEFELELIDLYNNNVHNYDDNNLSGFIKALKEPTLAITGTYRTIPLANILAKYGKSVKIPMLKDLPIRLKISEFGQLMYGYVQTTSIYQNRKSPKPRYSSGTVQLRHINPNESEYYSGNSYKFLLVDTTSLNPTSTKYLCETQKHSNWYVIKKQKNVRLFLKDGGACYYDYLCLRYVPKSKWRETIKAFQAWQDAYIKKHCVEYDKVQPTKQWLLDQKVTTKSQYDKTSLRKATGKILVKTIDASSRYYSTGTFRNTDWPINLLGTRKEFIIYGTDDDKDTLSKLHLFSFLVKPAVKMLITAKSNHKYFQGLPNYMHVNKFMEGKNKYFAYYASLYRLYEKAYECEGLFKAGMLLKILNTPLYEVLQKVNLYRKEYEKMKHRPGYHSLPDFIKNMAQTAVTNNYLDWELEALHDQLQKGYDKYGFLNLIADNGSNHSSKVLGHHQYNKEQVAFAKEACKFKKVRINTKHYIKNDGGTEEEII